jgi:hypothetical protein
VDLQRQQRPVCGLGRRRDEPALATARGTSPDPGSRAAILSMRPRHDPARARRSSSGSAARSPTSSTWNVGAGPQRSRAAQATRPSRRTTSRRIPCRRSVTLRSRKRCPQLCRQTQAAWIQQDAFAGKPRSLGSSTTPLPANPGRLDQARLPLPARQIAHEFIERCVGNPSEGRTEARPTQPAPREA